MKDATLGGYRAVHDRPPAFEGADGRSYSVGVYVDQEPDVRGFGAALLFIRWSERGDRPEGHLETAYLAYGATPEEAEAALLDLTLHQIKQQLDDLITTSGGATH